MFIKQNQEWHISSRVVIVASRNANKIDFVGNFEYQYYVNRYIYPYRHFQNFKC